ELFETHWHLLAHRSELAKDKDFLRFDVFDEELVVCNDAGSWFVFDNICPHRGTRIFRKDGGSGSITCPYHGWTYRKGELNVPKRSQFREEDLKRCSYNQYRLEFCGDFAFVSKRPK